MLIPLNGIWQHSATGLRMRAVRVENSFPPRGDPGKATLTTSRWNGMAIDYGCGCTWEVDTNTIRGALNLPSMCPNHEPSVGIAQGQAVAGGSLSVNLSRPPSMYYMPPPPAYASMIEAKWQPDPPPELELMFDTEPIVGWRIWRIVDFQRRGGIIEKRLAPLAAQQSWAPRERFEARCTRTGLYSMTRQVERHEAPWRDCDCGVWALRDRAAAEGKGFTDARQSLHDGTACIGPVNLWGRVMEFRLGYRAQYAYPKALIFFGGKNAALAKEVGNLYGVSANAVEVPPALGEAIATDPYSFANGYFSVSMASTAAHFNAALKKMTENLAKSATDERAKVDRDFKHADDEARAILERAKKPVPPRPRPTFRDSLRGR